MTILTFDQLFEAYSRNYSNEMLTERQIKHLKRMHEKMHSTDNLHSMTLSQSDLWFKQANVLQKKVLSLTDTGMCFSKFKKFALTKKEYLKFVHQLCEEKKLDKDQLMERLVNAGLPVISVMPRKLSLTTQNLLDPTPTQHEPITEKN